MLIEFVVEKDQFKSETIYNRLILLYLGLKKKSTHHRLRVPQITRIRTSLKKSEQHKKNKITSC